VLWAFLLFVPWFSVWVFGRTEANLRRHDGIGKF
jgi:hypothetical protein